MKQRSRFGWSAVLLFVFLLSVGFTVLAQKRTLDRNGWVVPNEWFGAALTQIQATVGDAFPALISPPSSRRLAQPPRIPTTPNQPSVASNGSPQVEILTSDTAVPVPSGGQYSSPSIRFANSLSPSSLIMPAFMDLAAVPDGAGGLTGNWTANASGSWGNPGNWSGGVIPSGANSNAHFDTLDITTDVTVSLDVSRTIGELFVGDTNGTNRYTIGPGTGHTLTFDNAGVTSVLTQSSTSAGDTISVPLILANSLDVTNQSSNVLTLSGNISTSAPNSSFTQLSFQGGNVDVTGNINNGTDDLFVSVNGGTVRFSGMNSYLGQTSVDGGTLLVNGDQSAATGTVFVSGSGSLLGGTGEIGGTVFMFGDSTITGATASTVGTLTLEQNLFLATGEGAGGIYLANLSGSTSDLLDITGNLILGDGSSLMIQGPGDGTTTYVLATFASHTDEFDTVSGVPFNYMLVYNQTDIQLVPIPEPASWIAGAFALGALVFAKRKRKAETLKRGP